MPAISGASRDALQRNLWSSGWQSVVGGSSQFSLSDRPARLYRHMSADLYAICVNSAPSVNLDANAMRPRDRGHPRTFVDLLQTFRICSWLYLLPVNSYPPFWRGRNLRTRSGSFMGNRSSRPPPLSVWRVAIGIQRCRIIWRPKGVPAAPYLLLCRRTLFGDGSSRLLVPHGTVKGRYSGGHLMRIALSWSIHSWILNP